MAEKFHRLKANLVKKLRRASGKTWEQVAVECGVIRETIMRWLSETQRPGEANVRLLAKAIGTTADKIILLDDEEDLTDYVNGELNIDRNYDELKQPEDIAALLEEFQRRIGKRYKILLMYNAPGSIKIGIKLHVSDAMRLSKAFLQGKLRDLRVTSITFKSDIIEENHSHPIESLSSQISINTTSELVTIDDHSWKLELPRSTIADRLYNIFTELKASFFRKKDSRDRMNPPPASSYKVEKAPPGIVISCPHCKASLRILKFSDTHSICYKCPVCKGNFKTSTSLKSAP